VVVSTQYHRVLIIRLFGGSFKSTPAKTATWRSETVDFQLTLNFSHLILNSEQCVNLCNSLIFIVFLSKIFRCRVLYLVRNDTHHSTYKGGKLLSHMNSQGSRDFDHSLRVPFNIPFC